MDKNILKIRNLVKQYDNSQNVILKGIDLDLNEEDFLCILGPSGCGKSTMIRCIAGFEGYEGTIEVSGEKVTKPGPDRIMVFQDFNQLFPWKTVLGNITYPLKVGGMKNKEERIFLLHIIFRRQFLLETKLWLCLKMGQLRKKWIIRFLNL